VSCGYLNPPGSSWCHRCGAGWLDRTEQSVARARGGPDEPLSLRRAASEGWRRKRPASVAARALTGAAIVAWIFAVGAVVVLNSGASADRASRSSRTPAQEIKRGRSAAASALAERQTPTTGSPTAPAPTTALDAYWRNVKRHAFADAYSRLLPGSLNLTEAQFVASEKQIKIQRASFRASVTSRTGSRATVLIGSLITRDQRYGCQTWSGSYELIETAGRWRIARAAITPRPCVN
jgi:hypothetical protein